MSATSKNIHQRLLEVKKRVSAIEKDTTGFGFKYQSPATVLNAVNPVLNDNGVMCELVKAEFVSHERITYSVKGKKKPDGSFGPDTDKTETQWLLNYHYEFVNVDDPSDRVHVEWPGVGLGDNSQAIGGASTYAQRYLFLYFFQIPERPPPENLMSDKMTVDNDELKNKILNANNMAELTLLWDNTDPTERENFKTLFGARRHNLEKPK